MEPTHESHDGNLASVLAAEDAADRRLAEARDAARQRLQDAVRQERRIAERADERLKTLHARVRKDLAIQKQQMTAGFERQKQSETIGPAPEELQQIVLALARRLVGIETR